jgi:tRNA pseudouridine32 synthase/23S rRNA pseudouridine746 synthase
MTGSSPPFPCVCDACRACGWILHHDGRLLVLDKPAGLLAVPGRGPHLQDCVAGRVQALLPAARVVHRLDRDTSGLMLMALDAESQRHVGRQFEARTVHKVYECVVRGVPAAEGGVVDLPIARDPDRPPRYRIDPARGRPSQTAWRLLERRDATARLEVEPLTGRSHQIRLHLATLGHPILGDPLYGDDGSAAAAGRMLLHATRLAVAHPDDDRTVAWHSPCPF